MSNLSAELIDAVAPTWIEDALADDRGGRFAAPASSVALRPYQRAAIDGDRRQPGIRSTLHDNRSALLILPTGCGKTVVFTSYAAEVVAGGGRALILAHREELISQASGALARLGLDHAIEKAQSKARDSVGLFGGPLNCVVGSKDTLQGRRLLSWDPGYFDLVIVDEAHHAPAMTYKNIFAHFRTAKILGVTATADRLDGENLGKVFDAVAYEYSLAAAIGDGWLCPLEVVRCQPDPPIDLSQIRTTGGDMNAGDLEDAISGHIEALVNVVKPELGHRQAIVFTPDVGSAQAFAQGLSQIGVPARAVSGESPNRAELIAGYQAGEYQVLCNCQLLTEGFDAPNTSAIVLARPTKSRSLYAQMVGRGTRLAKGKDKCLIIDFAWLTGRHQLVSPVELFDTGALDAEVESIARALLESGQVRDVKQAIDDAERKHAERVRIRVQVRERQARYRRVSYDPIGVRDVLGLPTRNESAGQLAVPATPAMVRALSQMGVDGAAGMSRRQAGAMLDELNRRFKAGLATHKQVAWLINMGVDAGKARSLTKSEASGLLDQLFGKRVG